MLQAVRHGYPLLLDVSDRLVVIVGGGAVALRKAQGLLSAGARRVRCIAPRFHEQMPAEVERVAGPFEESLLEGAELVFAATDSAEVNEAVVREARRRGVLVNRADFDEREPGDFATPAVWRDGAVMFTISAGGNAALAARMRDDLAGKVDPRQVELAAALQRIRPMLRQAKNLSPQRRAQALRELAGEGAMVSLGEGGVEGLRAWLLGRYPELSEGMRGP